MWLRISTRVCHFPSVVAVRCRNGHGNHPSPTSYANRKQLKRVCTGRTAERASQKNWGFGHANGRYEHAEIRNGRTCLQWQEVAEGGFKGSMGILPESPTVSNQKFSSKDLGIAFWHSARVSVPFKMFFQSFVQNFRWPSSSPCLPQAPSLPHLLCEHFNDF